MPGSISFSLLCEADLEKEYDMFKIHTVNIHSIRDFWNQEFSFKLGITNLLNIHSCIISNLFLLGKYPKLRGIFLKEFRNFNFKKIFTKSSRYERC